MGMTRIAAVAGCINSVVTERRYKGEDAEPGDAATACEDVTG